MIRILGIIVAVIWWLWIVFAACASIVLVGLLITHFLFADYYRGVFYILLVVGAILGAIWAEKTRKQIGLDKYFGTVTGAPTKGQSMRREDY